MKYFIKIVNLLILTFSIFLSSNYVIAAKIIEKLPGEINFITQNGEDVNFEKYEDQVLLVYFWATWCQNCFQQMVELDQLQKEYRKQPFKIIPLSIDFKGLEVIQAFYNQYNIKFLDIFWDKNNVIFKELLISSVPTTLLIGKDLRIIQQFNGIINWKDKINRDLINLALEELKS